MGKKCFVPNCSSGYCSCKEKASLFKAPTDPDRLALWDSAIPRSDRKLQPGDCVCEKHFSPHLISRTYHVEHERKVLLDAPKRSVLSTEAVPSMFPNCPNYLSTSSKTPQKAPRKRPLVTHVASFKRRCSLNVLQSESTTVVDITLPVEPAPACCSDDLIQGVGREKETKPVEVCSLYPVQTATDALEEEKMSTEGEQGENLSTTTGPSLFFKALFATAEDVVLPNNAWGTHLTDAFGTKTIVFSKLQPSRIHGAEPSQAKTMTVSCDVDKLQLKTFIWGSCMDLDDKLQASEITSTSDLTAALQESDDLQA